MALIICVECGHKISDKAKSCPHCGCPIEFMFPDGETPQQSGMQNTAANQNEVAPQPQKDINASADSGSHQAENLVAEDKVEDKVSVAPPPYKKKFVRQSLTLDMPEEKTTGEMEGVKNPVQENRLESAKVETPQDMSPKVDTRQDKTALEGGAVGIQDKIKNETVKRGEPVSSHNHEKKEQEPTPKPQPKPQPQIQQQSVHQPQAQSQPRPQARSVQGQKPAAPATQQQQVHHQAPKQNVNFAPVMDQPEMEERPHHNLLPIIGGVAALAIVVFGIIWFFASGESAGEGEQKERVSGLTVYDMEWDSPLGNAIYSGEVNAEGQPDGDGEAKIVGGEYKGAVYEGKFKNGKMEGLATYTAPNGDIFEGYFINNEYKEGQYTFTKDGVFYIGTFENGQPAEGTYYNKDGTQWRN